MKSSAYRIFGGRAAQARLHFLLEPFVEHVVKIDIGQQGTDDLPLSGPGLRDQEPAVFHDTDVNPFPNQAEDVPIAYPSLDERHELAPHDGVEVAPTVCFKDIRNRAATDRAAHRVERVVGTPSRTEPVGACEEVLLVDRVEHLDRRLLYDLVLQGRNRDGTLFSVLLRDIDPPQWLRSIPVAHQPVVELLDVLPCGPFVFRVGDVIDTRTRVFPQAIEGFIQRLRREQMRQREKSRRLVRLGSLGSPTELCGHDPRPRCVAMCPSIGTSGCSPLPSSGFRLGQFPQRRSRRFQISTVIGTSLNGLIFVGNRMSMNLEELHLVCGVTDLYRIDRELDHLRSLELLEPQGGFGMRSTATIALVTPSPLALQMFVTLSGYRGDPVEFYGLKQPPDAAVPQRES